MLSKASRYFGIGFVLAAVGGVAACSSSDSPTTGGTAGTSSGTAGTSSGTGGTGSGTAGTGSGTAGTSTGTAGTSSGTAGTSSGTAGSGAGGGAPAAACTAPTGASVTSFADLVANATSAGNFNFTAGRPGGTYHYPTPPIVIALSDSGMALNAKGTVANYDGFGVYLNTCVDASAYTGVSFNIKGDVGPTGKISFRIHTWGDSPNVTGAPGGCPVPAGTAVGGEYPFCHAAATEITVPAGGGVVNVLFTEPTAGVPVATVNPKEINGFEWAFDYTAPTAAGGATSYAADVTVDDVKFTSGTAAGGTGAGGTGGASGGTGGASGGTGGASAGTGGA